MTATNEQRGLSQQQFGIYRLDAVIGRGAVGEVYRAFDTTKKRAVALKVLAPQFAADTEFQARFRRESELAAMLTNPHIVPIHDFGEIERRLFLDMRLIDGPNLAALIAQDGAMPAARAVDLVCQVASALSAAHAHGLIHRDVKPSNVLTVPTEVGDGDFAYLADFGVARSVGGRGSTAITGQGSTIGTLEYMAPERFESDDLDHRVDIYALGCVLYECLTGQQPYAGRGLTALAQAHVHGTIPLPSEAVPGIPRALDDVVATAMAKNPDDRYPTTGAFATACQDAIKGTPPEDRRQHHDVPSPRTPDVAETVPPGTAEHGRQDQRDAGISQAETHVPGPRREQPIRYDPQPPSTQQVPQNGPWPTRPGPYPGPGPLGPDQWTSGPPQTAQGERRSPWFWVALAAVALLILGGVGTAVVVATTSGGGTAPTTAAPPPPSAAPSTTFAPTTTVAAPPGTAGYTVSTMFGAGNGTCQAVPVANRLAFEIDSISCTNTNDIIAYYSQYSGTPDQYIASLRADESLTMFQQIGLTDCYADYQAEFTTTDGIPYHEYVRVYTRTAFSAMWTAPKNTTTFQEIIDEPFRVANSDALCGR